MSNHTEEQRVADETVEAGKEVYDRQIRHLVEPDHNGRFLIVDVTTGGYHLADTDVEALEKAETANPAGRFYLLRVGYRSAYRIGSGLTA